MIRRNKVSLRTWEEHHRRFEDMIDQLSDDDPCFYFIQIGACDGIMADPIHARIKEKRWRGILVEPQKNEFDRLRQTYEGESARLVFENVAIADTPGKRNLYKVRDDLLTADWQRGIASLIPNPALAKQGILATETVDCITFEQLLQRNNVTEIDLLQIDAEGYDYQLLQCFDFRNLKPRLIRYEHMHLSLKDMRSCAKLLRRNGYEILEMENDTAAILRYPLPNLITQLPQ